MLADFGIAMVLANASVQQIESSSGTPRYMAPEQFQGVISKESDQYALGCIAYEMFTGHQAFVAPDIHALAYPILTSYFNLGLALVGFVTGFAFLKTSGRYVSRRSLKGSTMNQEL